MNGSRSSKYNLLEKKELKRKRKEAQKKNVSGTQMSLFSTRATQFHAPLLQNCSNAPWKTFYKVYHKQCQRNNCKKKQFILVGKHAIRLYSGPFFFSLYSLKADCSIRKAIGHVLLHTEIITLECLFTRRWWLPWLSQQHE